jgi:hypothetical protein
MTLLNLRGADVEGVKDFVRSLKEGTVLRPTELAERLGGDVTVGLAACIEEGLVRPVYSHTKENPEWVELKDLGSAATVDPSKVLVGFIRTLIY